MPVLPGSRGRPLGSDAAVVAIRVPWLRADRSTVKSRKEVLQHVGRDRIVTITSGNHSLIHRVLLPLV